MLKKELFPVTINHEEEVYYCDICENKIGMKPKGMVIGMDDLDVENKLAVIQAPGTFRTRGPNAYKHVCLDCYDANFKFLLKMKND